MELYRLMKNSDGKRFQVSRDKNTANVIQELLNTLQENSRTDRTAIDFEEECSKNGNDASDSQKQIYENIMKIGILYRKAMTLVDHAPNSSVLEGMNSIIRKCLDKLYSTVTGINAKNNTYRKFGKEYATQRWALVWSREYITSFQFLVSILIATRNMAGNMALDIIKHHMHHGNYQLSIVAHRIFEAAAEPFCKMIWIWLLFGTLKDPYNDFFIVESQNPIGSWNGKYSLRKELVPKLLPMDTACLILESGRLISFVLENCEEPVLQCPSRNYLLRTQKEPHCGLLSLLVKENSKTFYIIQDLYIDYSKTALLILRDKYNLTKFFMGSYWYNFLALGNFGRYFLELIYPIYYTNVESLEVKTIESILNQAVISTSPFQFKKEKEKEAKFVLVNWENVVKNDKLCDVLEISYERGGPISEIFSCFRLLHNNIHGVVWKMQQMQYSLSNQKKILINLEKNKNIDNKNPSMSTCNFKTPNCKFLSHQISAKVVKSSFSGIKNNFKELFTLISNFNQFVNHVNFYLMNEIIEEGWKKFWKVYTHAKTIDEVINMYGMLLNNISDKISEVSNKEMSINLNFIRNLIRDIEKLVIRIEDDIINKNGTIKSDEIKAKTIIFKEKFLNAVQYFLNMASCFKKNENYIFLCNRINFNMYFSTK